MPDLLPATLRRLGGIALDVLLPPQCLSCDTPVKTQGGLCPACFESTSFITEPCCDACGVPFPHGQGSGAGRTCAACALAPPPWGRARAAIRYDAQAKRLILPLKYSDRIELAAPLAALMARAGEALLREADVLVPVPLHRSRLFARRYNQAALLAQALGRLTGMAVAPDAIRRLHATASLGELGAASRKEVVESAFAVPPDRLPLVAKRRVLLIDDVLTSGATCGACTEALFDAGAREVNVLVVARVGLAWVPGDAAS